MVRTYLKTIYANAEDFIRENGMRKKYNEMYGSNEPEDDVQVIVDLLANEEEDYLVDRLSDDRIVVYGLVAQW